VTGSAPSVSRSANPPLVVRKGRFAIHSDSEEHIRLEGYLTNSEFVAALRSGFGRIAFGRRNTPMQSDGAAIWSDALVILTLQRKQYWRAVAHYKATTITRCWAKLPNSDGIARDCSMIVLPSSTLS